MALKYSSALALNLEFEIRTSIIYRGPEHRMNSLMNETSSQDDRLCVSLYSNFMNFL